MAQLSLTAGMDVRDRVMCCADTELKEIVLEALRLLDSDANICVLLAADLDRAAKEAKKNRLADGVWRDAGTPALPGLPTVTVASIEALDPGGLSLGIGCPRRLDAEAVFVFSMCRAHLGSVTSRAAIDRLWDSVLLHEYLDARGLQMPSRSSLHACLNQVSAATHEYLLNAQTRLLIRDGLEDGQQLAIDSFSVEGSTQWPTDSNLIQRLLARAHRLGGKLDRFGLPVFSQAYIPAWLKELHRLDFTIACTAGKAHSTRKVKQCYRQFLGRAAKLASRLVRECNRHRATWAAVALVPSQRRQLDALLAQLEGSLHAALRVIQYAEDRVFNGIVLPAAEKVLSLADDCAAYIAKGGREPVIGYKPQVARSGQGFITAIEIMAGNPNDAARLVPMVEQHIQRTGIVPKTLTVDDGYSSRKAVLTLKGQGVVTVSISGAKGKRITAAADWESEAYRRARADRSAVESQIFTLRHKFHLYRFSRRGLDAVRAELMEKVIAYNLLRASVIRRRLREAAAAAPAA